MITITQRTARQVRAVFRRALGTTRGPGPRLSLGIRPEGLCFRIRHGSVAVEYHERGDHPPQELTVPLELLADCQAAKDEPVQIDRDEDGGVTAAWIDGGIPQLTQYDSQGDIGEMPTVPDEMAGNSQGLTRAFHDAAATADRDATRYAVNAIQLKGATGQIVATDGRQLLVSSGFEFPWDDDVLVPRTSVFGSRELAGMKDTAIGKTDQWVVIRVGPWTTWLEVIQDARYPDVVNHVPRAADASTTLRLTESDAEFLVKSLKRLPCGDPSTQSVTVDANGSLSIRAKSQDRQQPTELVLRGSEVKGDALQVNTNSEYLARAVKLGFRDVHLYGPEQPACCRDEHRSYVWALLGKEGVIKPSDNAIRIESPVAEAHVNSQPTKSRRRKTNNMSPANTRKSNGQQGQDRNTRILELPNNGAPRGDSPAAITAGSLDQAMALRETLRTAAKQAGELVKAIKAEKRQSRIVRSTLASLRSLEAIDA